MHILLDLYALNAGDEAKEQVHNGGGVHVTERVLERKKEKEILEKLQT
mgnify:CR=1 FL=1